MTDPIFDPATDFAAAAVLIAAGPTVQLRPDADVWVSAILIDAGGFYRIEQER